jgi:hypothetical protein
VLTCADVAGKGVREAKEALKKAEIGKKAESFAAGTKFTFFASTKVQILTPAWQRARKQELSSTKVQILTPARQRERRNGSRS